MSHVGVNKTNFYEAQILGALASGITIGLFTTAPGESSGGTEVTGGSYARQSVSFGSVTALTPPDTGSSISNDTDIVFPTPTAVWGTVNGIGLFDGSDNLIYYAVLSPGVPMSPSTLTPTIPAGFLVVIED